MATVAMKGACPAVAAAVRGRSGSRPCIGRRPVRRKHNVQTPFDFYSPPWSAVGWANMRGKRHEKEVSTQR